ncbi:MAG TPA: carboxypeptidase regulatory-like domain-containing protein [Candidatus Dormibacteraeota bacterium]|nr:carboxypeptidase regulatory-like domain-containing protein [Candidatus Dormibacteraeota bacterium]
MRSRHRLLGVLVLSLAFCGLAHAQSGSLHGTVIVPSGQAIPGASVTVSGPGGPKNATTNQVGQYIVEGLVAGAYTIKVKAAGFEAFEIGVAVAANENREVDAVLNMSPPPPVEPASAQSEATAAPPQTPAETQPKNEPPALALAPVATPQAVPATPKKGKAAIYGLATDPTGAVIPGATANISGTAGSMNTSADSRGQYTLNGLAPGEYKLQVTAPGFASFETDITVTENQSLEIDAALQPPSVAETANVVSQQVAIPTLETAQIEGEITNKEIVSTGLNGRNFTQLIALAPGVSNQTGQDEARVGLAGSVKYSVNGGRVEYNNFDVDGSDVLNAGLNGAESTLMVYPSLDAIQDVKVLTSNYGAMYGRSASGTVLVTTKSGTQQFHGGAYDFVRNEFFNARNYFDLTTKAPLYRRQDFGFDFGGPLSIPGVFNTKKDKTFFFFSEEFRLERSPLGPGGSSDFNQAVPTVAERNGDFSDVCPFAPGSASVDFQRSAFPDCPAGGIAISGSGFRTFPGNQVLMDSRSAALLGSGLIPVPNSSIGCNSSLAGKPDPNTGVPLVPCYDTVVSPSTYWREELFRLDHNITPNLRASFRYIHDSWDTTVVTPQWGYILNNSFPTVQNRLNGPGINMVVRLTDTITPSLLNDFVVSYADAHITLRDIAGPGANLDPSVITRGHTIRCPNCTPPTLGDVGYIFNNGFGGKLPGLIIAGTNSEYGGNGFAVDTSYMPWDHTNPTYSLADNVSKVLGKHTLQFGLQVVDAQRNETNAAVGAATGDKQGLFTFSNQNSVLTTGNAFADFLFVDSLSGRNSIKSFQQDSSQGKYYNDYWVIEPYVQDDWRVNRRLNLNLGLRFSLFGNYHERNLNAYNWVQGAFDRNLAATVQIAPADALGQNGGYLQDLSGNPITVDSTSPLNGLNSVLSNGLVQCGKNNVPSSCMTSHLFNPSPRIGFAWDPMGDGKTSIRGGYGIFFEHGTGQEANTGSLQGSAPLVLTMTSAFPSAYDTVGTSQFLNLAAGQSLAYPLDVTSIPTRTVWPYVQQWSFSAQRQLSKDTLATVAYVGSKGTHLTAELQLNQLAPLTPALDTGIFPTGNPFPLGAPLTVQTCKSFGAGVPNSFTLAQNGFIVTPKQPAWTNLAAACFGNGASQDIPNPNSLRTYAPSFGRVLSLQNIADSQYHALQVTMRRVNGPLTLGLAYTYSHSFDDSSDRSDASFVNSADIKSSWASSNFDQRHLLSVNYIYSVPKLSGAFERRMFYGSSNSDSSHEADAASPQPAQSASRFLHLLLDGWQVSGITAFQSGTPFSVINGGSANGISVLDNAGVANGSGAGSFPDIIGSPRSQLSNGVLRFNTGSIGPLLYNPGAFAAPRGLTFGNAGRNFLNNPNRLNFDMTLLKNFKVTEGSNLEFRAEAFNVFNHTQFRLYNPNLGNSASNTINCFGGPDFSAAGGLTTLPGIGGAPTPVDCTTGSSFLHPVDAHRPRTLQLGLKYTF